MVGLQRVVVLLVLLLVLYVDIASAAGTEDGSKQWGYVTVRPKAHLFWLLYRSPNRVEDPNKPWPTIIWLDGGPGASGVGSGNFLQIGPLHVNLKPRKWTWLQKADLLFVDSPVGTGFSYVDYNDTMLAVKTDEEAARDMIALLKELFNSNESLQQSPLYVVGASYGGKFAVTVGLSALNAVEAGELKLKLGGVAFGNGWISPEDFVFSWAPILKMMSRIDNNGFNVLNRGAQKIQQKLREGQIKGATDSWIDLVSVVIKNISNDVDLFNFMYDQSNDPFNGRNAKKTEVALETLMNGVIKDKLQVIPANVTWGAQRLMVYDALKGDFLKPRVNEVEELLSRGIHVTIYNGQVDLIASTMGVEAWVEKLKWDGLNQFLSQGRTALYCGRDATVTKGFTKSYKNLHFYWILGAGHLVPVDQPCVAFEMIGNISRSPSTSS